MICTTGVTIHKPLEQVWETFMLPANWKRWWGTELRKVDSGWGPDALMVWEVGFPSRVLRVIRGQELKIETQRSIITWWFTALDGETTMVQMEEKFTSDAPASMRNWHTEMAVVLEALHALAEGHEIEILPAHARAHIMPPDPSPRLTSPRSSRRSTWGIAMAAALLFLVVVMTQVVSNFYVNQLGYNPGGVPYSLALAQTPRGDALIPVTGAGAFGNGEVIYQHDFVREGRGWDAFSGETWLENGSLHLLADAEAQQIVVLGGTAGILEGGYDFQVEMVAAPHVQELHGLIFNFTDRSHFYQFSVWPESLRFELLLRDGETWKILTPVQGSDALLPYPAVNRLGVRCADGAIELYINGKQSAVLKDGLFAPGGAVGVFAGGGTGELEVDNVQIQAFSTP